MAVTGGFFNSKNGDRKYNAEQISRYFDKIITSGVFPNPSTNLQVVEAGGMNVQVMPGRGMMDCHWINNDSNLQLALEPSDVVLNRIDAIIMKLDLTEEVRSVSIEIKKGVNAQTPTPPTMTRSDYVKEYALAYVRVDKLVTELTQSNITDTRPNTSVCGWVTGLIDQVETETLFIQWQDAYSRFYEESNAVFDEWFNHLRETVSTATLIRTFISSYTTTVQDETVIPINIVQYNIELDILNVYINGLKLIRDIDYDIDDMGRNITLAKPVDKGTPIAFEVLKSVDGSGAETIVGQVEQVQADVLTLRAETESMSEAIGSFKNPVELYAGAFAPDEMSKIKYLPITNMSNYDIMIVRCTMGTIGEEMMYFYKGAASAETKKINQTLSVYLNETYSGCATLAYDGVNNQLGLRAEALKGWTIDTVKIVKVWGIKL